MVTKRMPSAERRDQVVVAAIELLAELPLEKITTRLLARRVGISQPALFRHFRTRDAVLAAVADHARKALSVIAGRALDIREPLDALTYLTEELLGLVQEFPGIPRLLFLDAATTAPAARHASLKLMVSMQKALVAELIRTAQDQGSIDPRVCPRRASHLYISLIQGTLLQWQHGDREASLTEQGQDLLALWTAGMAQGAPTRRESEPHEKGGLEAAMLQKIDVRSILAEGVDPLEAILECLEAVEAGGMLEILAPFRPTPLLGLLTAKGHVVEAEELGEGAWRVWVWLKGKSCWLDLRDMEAPEPLERILEACSSLERGDVLLAALPRFPSLLLPRLEERGLTWQVLPEVDGGALLAARSQD